MASYLGASHLSPPRLYTVHIKCIQSQTDDSLLHSFLIYSVVLEQIHTTSLPLATLDVIVLQSQPPAVNDVCIL